MKIKSIYITATLFSVLLITVGCGAKDASVFKSEKNKGIPAIGEDEAVGLILGKYDFFNSFSKLDTAQKREALENVLVPYSEDENIKMAKNCGFSHCEVVFRWANFATFIAIK